MDDGCQSYRAALSYTAVHYFQCCKKTQASVENVPYACSSAQEEQTKSNSSCTTTAKEMATFRVKHWLVGLSLEYLLSRYIQKDLSCFKRNI